MEPTHHPSDSSLPVGARRLVGGTYVIPGLTNSVFIDGLLLDTGPEESLYEGVGIDTLAITHGHADHFAAGAALRRSGTRVIAARDDASLVENPELNIRGMFSWAKPGDKLVTKLFRGEPCPVDGYVADWSDPRASALDLAGHTVGHTGYLTADGVLATGDALYLEELWERHPLPYSIDPSLVAASLERIRGAGAAWLVPAHGRPIEAGEADRHIDHHLHQLDRIRELVIEGLRVEKTTEEAIALVSAARGLRDDPAQYWLAVTTVKGFLGNLLEDGAIEFFVRDHAGWWKTI